jgi:hypothetical protein
LRSPKAQLLRNYGNSRERTREFPTAGGSTSPEGDAEFVYSDSDCHVHAYSDRYGYGNGYGYHTAYADSDGDG